jgi:hypothetical protein
MISESPTDRPSWFLRHHPELLLDFQRLPQGEAVGGLISEKDFFLFACRLLDPILADFWTCCERASNGSAFDHTLYDSAHLLFAFDRWAETPDRSHDCQISIPDTYRG